MKKTEDDALMLDGVDMILGLKPYNIKVTDHSCDHDDDGVIYGSNTRRVILRCSLCGDFYEEDKF